MSKTISVLTTYLDAIGITGYTINTSQDGDEFLVVVEIPKENGGKIGILKGRNGRNLSITKSLLRIVGPLEGLNICLVVKLRS